MSLDSDKFGKYGEDLACKLLTEKKFEIVERNYTFGRGEIDIIAYDRGTLVFVEVKSRKNLEFGEPEYGITSSKIKQVQKVAAAYLYEKNIEEADIRFDVVAILAEGINNPVINHIENAF
jgi:putative endonuclease